MGDGTRKVRVTITVLIDADSDELLLEYLSSELEALRDGAASYGKVERFDIEQVSA